jgi:hypothetical protein
VHRLQYQGLQDQHFQRALYNVSFAHLDLTPLDDRERLHEAALDRQDDRGSDVQTEEVGGWYREAAPGLRMCLFHMAENGLLGQCLKSR